MSVFSSPFKEPFHNPFGSPFNAPGIGGGGGFNPTLWFLAGEQGIWLDPSDITRYMGEFGPELVSNGTFNVDTAGWTVVGEPATVSDGMGVLAYGALGASTLQRSIAVVVGRYYEITAKLVNVNSPDPRVKFGSSAMGATEYLLANTTGDFRTVVKATTATMYIQLQALTSGSVKFDNISIRELTAINTATLFQDSAGTTPVTAAGQPVGRILDKSGRGNHATQANASKKPILQQSGGLYYLQFDGVDDFLSTGSINFTSTDKMTVITGIMKGSDAARAIAYELSADINTNNGSFALEAPDANAAATLRPRSKGTVIATTSVASLVAGRKMVVTQQGDIAADAVSLRVDGADAGSAATDQGTGNYGNYPLYIGQRGGTSLPFNGHLYQLVVRGAQTADLAPGESFTAEKTGITL